VLDQSHRRVISTPLILSREARACRRTAGLFMLIHTLRQAQGERCFIRATARYINSAHPEQRGTSVSKDCRFIYSPYTPFDKLRANGVLSEPTARYINAVHP